LIKVTKTRLGILGMDFTEYKAWLLARHFIWRRIALEASGLRSIARPNKQSVNGHTPAKMPP